MKKVPGLTSFTKILLALTAVNLAAFVFVAVLDSFIGVPPQLAVPLFPAITFISVAVATMAMGRRSKSSEAETDAYPDVRGLASETSRHTHTRKPSTVIQSAIFIKRQPVRDAAEAEIRIGA
jgi:hypothetical protein